MQGLEAIVCGDAVHVHGITDFCPDHVFDCGGKKTKEDIQE